MELYQGMEERLGINWWKGRAGGKMAGGATLTMKQAISGAV